MNEAGNCIHLIRVIVPHEFNARSWPAPDQIPAVSNGSDTPYRSVLATYRASRKAIRSCRANVNAVGNLAVARCK